MRTTGTAPVWNSNGRCQWRMKFGTGELCGNINEGWNESSVVHHTYKAIHPTIGHCSTEVGSSE